jgi:hypothetical protein
VVTNYEFDDFEVESILLTLEVIGEIPFPNTFFYSSHMYSQNHEQSHNYFFTFEP